MKHVARKRFGQHFLTDRSVIESIADAIDPRANDVLIEIGPGQAALTDALLARISHMTAIELDRDLAAWLRKRFDASRLTLIEQDVLRVDFHALAASQGKHLRLAGNLPYNISSPLMVSLVPVRASVIDQHFMLQKEVVDRITAGVGEAAYGRLGVLLQNYYDCDALFDVPPEAFDPPPKVVSAVLRMLPRVGAADADAPPLPVLETLLAHAFAQRRKMLRGTLIPWLQQQQVDVSMLTPTDRAEDVPVDVYRALANELARLAAPPDQ